MTTGRLAGKVALVTGASAGIGAAAARLFAEEGVAVVAVARREEEGGAVVRDIESVGGRALFVRADVSSAEDCERMVSRTVEHFGRLDVAFNNAGVDQFGTPVAESWGPRSGTASSA